MTTPPVALSPRQEEIFALLAEGLTAKEVGQRLDLSFKTVEVYIDRAITVLGAVNRVQAVLMWDRAQQARAAVAAAEEAQRQQAEAERQRAEAMRGFVHCPSCGGHGFVREGTR